ncbi:MAG: AEC family transporter [Dongiaceae bacterium]
MFAELAAIVAPILVCSGIGLLWGRLERPFESEFLTAIVTTIGTPCLVFSTLTALETDRGALGDMAVATFACFAAFAVVGMTVLRFMGLPFHSYLPAVMFPNTGNMGLPLSLFAFGEQGLALAIVVFAISASLQFTVGVGIAAGHANWMRLLRMPLLYAVAVAIPVLVLQIPVPAWVANTTSLLGGLVIPLMLITLGVSLSKLRIVSLGRSLTLSLVRLVPGAIIGLAAGWIFELGPMGQGVLAIQCAMPVAVFNYLFAQLYRREPEEVAGAVVLSTLISFVTLPLLLYYILSQVAVP